MEEKKSNFHLRTVRLCGILLFSVALFYAAVCTPFPVGQLRISGSAMSFG